MDSLRQKLERLRFLLDRIKYSRQKHFCLVLMIILFAVSAFSVGSYLYQKNEIAKKDNILKSYFSGINKQEDDTLVLENSIDKGKDYLTVDNKKEEARIMIYICGSVNRPGVYELESDSRICDALKICGGASDGACIDVINLAEKVVDGQRIYIPSTDEVDESEMAVFNTSLSGSYKDKGRLININLDPADQLQKLPGIGQQISRNIIEYRQNYGPFKSIEEIKNVNGIGDKKYEKIKDLISI